MIGTRTAAGLLAVADLTGSGPIVRGPRRAISAAARPGLGWPTSAAVDSSMPSREHHHDATADRKTPGPGGTATPAPAGRVAAAKQGGAPSPFPGEVDNQGEWESGTSGSDPRGRARLRLAQSRADSEAQA